MNLKIFDNASIATHFLADELLEQVRANPASVLGVATGRTMDAVYHNLVSKALKEGVSFQKIKAFAVDEYVGLAKDSLNSYKAYLDLHLFDRLDFNPKNIFLPDVHNPNIDEACAQYEDAIRAVGGIDFQLLGIGLNGHIGLNEPGSSLDSRTRIVALTSSTRSSNKVLFKNESMPITAVTIGIGTILDSKKCYLIATGETKAEIVQKLVNGDVNSKVPATALKQHKNLTLILDKDAAKLI